MTSLQSSVLTPKNSTIPFLIDSELQEYGGLGLQVRSCRAKQRCQELVGGTKAQHNSSPSKPAPQPQNAAVPLGTLPS